MWSFLEHLVGMMKNLLFLIIFKHFWPWSKYTKDAWFRFPMVVLVMLLLAPIFFITIQNGNKTVGILNGSLSHVTFGHHLVPNYLKSDFQKTSVLEWIQNLNVPNSCPDCSFKIWQFIEKMFVFSTVGETSKSCRQKWRQRQWWRCNFLLLHSRQGDSHHNCFRQSKVKKIHNTMQYKLLLRYNL